MNNNGLKTYVHHAQSAVLMFYSSFYILYISIGKQQACKHKLYMHVSRMPPAHS